MAKRSIEDRVDGLEKTVTQIAKGGPAKPRKTPAKREADDDDDRERDRDDGGDDDLGDFYDN